MSNPQPNFAKRKSKREQVREILSDHKWHRNSELLAAVGHTFSQRLTELRKIGRKEGFKIETLTKDGEIYWTKMYPKDTLF